MIRYLDGDGASSDLINIMLLVNALLRHGPGMVVYHLACGLDPGLFRVSVTSLDQPDVQLMAELRLRDIRVHQLPASLCPSKTLARVLKEQQVSIVHTHGLRADVIGRIAARLVGIPRVVSTIHDMPNLYFMSLGFIRGALALAAQVLTMPLCDVIVTVADAVGHAYAQTPAVIFRRRFATIHNGVPNYYCSEANDSADAKTHPLTVGAVGRLVPWKGFGLLVEAAAKLIPEFPDVRFVVAGDGPCRSDLQFRIDQSGITDRFRLVGYQTDVLSVLRDLDVFALTSLSECLPLALLEAMSAGKAIVASDVGGVGEAIIHGSTGFLVPPGDVPALLDALQVLLYDGALRQRQGSAARRRYVESFTVDRMIQAYARLYRTLCTRA